MIQVSDDGKGMSEEKIRSLLGDKNNQDGVGSSQ